MQVDLTLDLINATVQIDQAISEQKRMVGTGFLVSIPRSDGPPDVVMVTSAHVFEKMPAQDVRIGWRIKKAGNWVYAPTSLAIRSAEGPLWTKHPSQDIAVISLKGIAQTSLDTAISIDLIATEETFSTNKIKIGDEMQTLGYPHGLSANVQGFPILRSGKVASYPVGPSSQYPTFLLDITAVPGNSGGPVFINQQGPKGQRLVTGVLIKQVEDARERLELGVVSDATYIRQTIAMHRKTQMQNPTTLKSSQPQTPAQKDSRDLNRGTTAGQVAKPSSQETETQDGQKPPKTVLDLGL